MNISHKDFLDFCQKQQENNLGMVFRQKIFTHMQSGKMPDFRYGGSIVVKPELDLQKIKPEIAGQVSFLKQNKLAREFNSYGELPEHILEKIDEISFSSKTSLYNDAFAEKIVLLEIDGKSKLKLELHFPKSDFAANLIIVAKSGCEASIYIKKASKNSALHYAGLNIRVIAESKANISIFNHQNMDAGAVLFEDRVALIEKDAKVSWLDFSIGSAYASSAIASKLTQSGAASDMKFLYAAKENQQFDIYTSSLHEARNTTSNILTKGVISQKAKALSRGLVFIGKEAEGSQGYEKQDALLLGTNCEADAIPNLEINNHDVKCSHGSSVSQINPDQIFYLMSRGLSEDEAKLLIILGYFSPIIESLGKTEKQKIEKSISILVEGGL